MPSETAAARRRLPPPAQAPAPASRRRRDGSQRRSRSDPLLVAHEQRRGADRRDSSTLSLTCAVLETDAVQVVPDESQLGVDGRAAGAVRGGRRQPSGRPAQRAAGGSFSTNTSLRIINPDAIGTGRRDSGHRSIHYRVNSRVAANTSMQGRDLIYVLPPQYVRVASMVPADADRHPRRAGESFAHRRLAQLPRRRARDRRRSRCVGARRRS